MGEAKRRKAILGEDYGKVFSPLTMGSSQWETHLGKFHEAFQEHFEGGKSARNNTDPDDSLVKSLKFQLNWFKDWLEEYLTPYFPVNREEFMITVLLPWYEQLEELEDSHREDVEYYENFLNLIGGLLILYQLCSPYLSEEVAEEFSEPLRMFYERLSEMRAESDPEELEDEEDPFLEDLYEAFHFCFGQESEEPLSEIPPDLAPELNTAWQQMREVLKTYPHLTVEGFTSKPNPSRPEKELLEPQALEQFMLCQEWLSKCDRVSYLNTDYSSYNYVQMVNNWGEQEVSNGAFIAAAVSLEIPFESVRAGSTFVYLPLADKSIKSLGNLKR